MVISTDVVLDRDTRVDGVIITPTGNLIFDPAKNVTLESTANVVVRGRLTMRPGDHPVVHRLGFVGVDEERFVGGGMDVLDTDVGLWVMDDGVLDVAGSAKRAWVVAAGAIPAGTATILLQQVPRGWRKGDEVVLTPTRSPTSEEHYAAYDSATIAAIDGRTVTPSQPTAFDHPAVDVGRGVVRTAEILNLTRNVRIEGAPEGRTHVLIHSSRLQRIRYVAIRHVGPRQQRGGQGESVGVLGRYGLHFHHCMDRSRGSVARGVVVRDAGYHAFVPHMSNGVTFRECIAHATQDDAFWWDIGDPTDDSLWKHCVASQTLVGDSKYNTAGFVLGTGSGSACVGSVAVGCQGLVSSSGFTWPSRGGTGVWRFEDCVAHNNKANGIFVWQVDDPVHLIDRFVGYHHGGSGIRHGSYGNRYYYRDGIIYGCGDNGISVEAVSKEPDGQGNVLTFEGMLVDQAGLSSYCLEVHQHVIPPKGVGRFVRCELRGATKACIGYTNDGKAPDAYAAIDCVYDGNEFWLEDTIPATSFLRVRDQVHGSITLRRKDQPGHDVQEWNASVSAG